MKVKLIKKDTKSCNLCDNIIPDQEYCFDMLEKPKINRRAYFWQGNVGYFTDIIIKVNGDCLYSKTSKYYIKDGEPGDK